MTKIGDDRRQRVEELEALYSNGEVDSAFERLEEMLHISPDCANLVLLKAEWSLSCRRNPSFVGEVAGGYKNKSAQSKREQAVITRALKWAERSLAEARYQLAGQDIDDAFQSLETATMVASWEARIFLGKGLALVSMLPDLHSNSLDQPDTDINGILELRSGSLRAVQFLTSKVIARMRKEAESALERARELCTSEHPAWQEAIRQLIALAEFEDDADRILYLLEEIRQAGDHVQQVVQVVEGRMIDRVMKSAIQRVRQLLHRSELDTAGGLIELILMTSPHEMQVWMFLADWFALRKQSDAALSIYQWVMREANNRKSGPRPHFQISAFEQKFARYGISCTRCGNDLSSEAGNCPVCNHPLRSVSHSDLLLEDRYDITKLKLGQLASLGAIEILLHKNMLVEGISEIQKLTAQLDRRNPAMSKLDSWLRDHKSKADEYAYEKALAAAVALMHEGCTLEARAALQALNGRNDDRPAAWLALSLCSDEALTASALVIIRRATRISTEVWTCTPRPLRQHLISKLLAVGWLSDACDLLATMFTSSERKSKNIAKLVAHYAHLAEVRCAELLTHAREAFEEGRINDALAPIEQILQINSQHLDALLLRGQLHLAAGAPYSAAADFRMVIKATEPSRDGMNEEAVAALLGLARTYVALHDLPEAIATLEALPVDHSDVQVLRTQLEHQRQGYPAVRIREFSQGDEPMYSGVFAVQVRSVARWRENDRLAISRRDIVQAGHEFVSALGGLGESVGNPAFQLRFIASPDSAALARGRLSIALLCRVNHPIPEGAERCALELWDRLRSHLPMAEHYIYEYEPIFDESEVEYLLHPFEVQDAAEIVRHEDWAEDAYAVQPFTTSGTSLENLAWILLRQGEPCMVAIHLEPTRIQANEITEFRKNLERLRRIRLPDDNDNSAEVPFDSMRRTVFLPDGQRGSLVEMAGNLSQSLEKRAFMMRVTVASADSHAAMLTHHVASEICGPGGRYEVVHVVNQQALTAVRHNLAEIISEAWLPDNAPHHLDRLRFLVGELEAGWIFRLPLPGPQGIPGVERMPVKAAPPTALSADGITLGESVATVAGVPAIIQAGQADRRRHAYVIGKTGVGKSTLLEAMILQDIERGRGVAFLDPHGDSIESILARIPMHRMDDVIVFDPSDETRPIGLNFLEAKTDSERHRIATEFVQLLVKMYDPGNLAITGPIFQQSVTMAILTAMETIPGASLLEVVRILSDYKFARRLLPRITDPMVRIYWEEQEASTSDFHRSERLAYVISKFNRFVSDSRIRHIVGQSESALNFRALMDDRKILLVNLSKGKIGPESAEFLGFMLLQSLLIAALSRADQMREERDDYCLYVDEFQTFATESFAAMLSEGRKYGICLVMANQYLGQLSRNLREAVFGNVGSLIAFGVGSDDAQHLAPHFYPVFGMDDLLNLPKYTAAVRLLVDGTHTDPFAMRTRLVKRLPDWDLAKEIQNNSRMRYGRDIQAVHEEINMRFKLTS